MCGDLAYLDVSRVCFTRDTKQDGFCVAARDCPQFVTQSRVVRNDRNAYDVISKNACSRFLTRITATTEVCCPTALLLPDFDRIAKDFLPNQGRCNELLSSYISNGTDTHIYEFPWLVQIIYKKCKN